LALDNFDQKIKGYLGDIKLKKANQSIDWTPELFQEYVKCSEDPIYFVENYIQIINVNNGLQQFRLYNYQKEMLRSFHKERNTIVLASRQSGKSISVCAYILWYILFNSEKVVALLANDGKVAREMLSRVQFAYEYLPKWLQQGILEWNKGSIELENNSRVIAAATTKKSVRGFAINLLYIDETAFIENWEEFSASVMPTISSGDDSKIILSSTPCGLNHFHAIWVNARAGINNYNPILVNWRQVPGRDEKWKEDVLGTINHDIQKFECEYECEFLGSTNTLIAGWKLKELETAFKTPINVKEGLYQYVLPEKEHLYGIVCDVSRGKGIDYSAFQVIDITTMPYVQVCAFRSNTLPPADYASVILHSAKLYNQAIVLVEINDIGEQVSHTLIHEFGYENVLYTENAGRSGKRITGGFGKSGTLDKGIKTTKTVKTVGCSLLKLLLEQNQLILKDHETIKELSTFVRKATNYEAETGAHDDLVSCLFLFAWMSDQAYFKEHSNINTLMNLREKSEEEIENDMLLFGFVLSGGEDEEVPQGWKKVENPSWIRLPDFDHYIYY
jgi:hypothetical protein